MNFITLGQAAERLNISERWMGTLVRRGIVDGEKLGRVWYFDEEAIEGLVGKEILKKGRPRKYKRVLIEDAPEAAHHPFPSEKT